MRDEPYYGLRVDDIAELVKGKLPSAPLEKKKFENIMLKQVAWEFYNKATGHYHIAYSDRNVPQGCTKTPLYSMNVKEN